MSRFSQDYEMNFKDANKSKHVQKICSTRFDANLSVRLDFLKTMKLHLKTYSSKSETRFDVNISTSLDLL